MTSPHRILVTGGSGFIGVNFVREARLRGHAVLNLSDTPPVDPSQSETWRQTDILDRDAVVATFHDFRPQAVVHLAARADCDENTTVEAGYRANTDGTAHVLDAIRQTPSVERCVITSSQYVCAPGRAPTGDEDYFPHTVYGESKVITEKLTREAHLKSTWTIIRPTNIWGPWHPRYGEEIWRVIRRGYYVHPGGAPVVRSYGYVGNVVWQILRILELPPEVVGGRTFYVGDPPENIYGWTNAFSKKLTGKPARKVPRFVLRSLALAGDAISTATGRKFLITSSRYESMITNYVPPMAATEQCLGEPPVSLDQGVDQTVAWLDR